MGYSFLCMYVRMHVRTHIRICACVHGCGHVCTYVRAYMCTQYACTYACARTHACTCVCQLPRQVGSCVRTANLRTNILDFSGFDSSIMSISRASIFRPTGDLPESLCQAMLVGINLVGRLGVSVLANERLGWHYLSDTTCLIRPHLFSTASFV